MPLPPARTCSHAAHTCSLLIHCVLVCSSKIILFSFSCSINYRLQSEALRYDRHYPILKHYYGFIRPCDVHLYFRPKSRSPCTFSSCHLHTDRPHSLYFQAEHLCSSPGGLGTRLLNGIFVHFDASAMVLLRSTPISAPGAFIATLPFRPSTQHHSHWRAAPGRGLVSAPDSSLPMGHS